MDIKNRLTELVDKAKEEYTNDVTDHTETDYIVECLLNNDVVVPPCKVGDTVFFIDTCMTAEDFGKKFVSFAKTKKVSLDSRLIVLESGQVRLWEDVLTKEEAEKALEHFE